MDDRTFDDLLAANARYAEAFQVREGGFAGTAQAGVAILTCMDSRIEPLAMVGLELGDAKVLRTPGGQLTPEALIGLILGTQLLGVDRIMVVAHTRCAMVGGDEAIRARARESAGTDLGDLAFGSVTDQRGKLRRDIDRLRSEPLIADHASIGGFRYDVDTGRLEQLI